MNHYATIPMVKEPPGIIQAKLNSKYHERSDLRHINTLFLNPKINQLLETSDYNDYYNVDPLNLITLQD